MLINGTTFFFIALFVATAFFFVVAHHRYNSRKAILLFQVAVSFYVMIFCAYLIYELYTDSPTFLFMREKIFGLSFNLEPIGLVFLNMVSVLWFLTSVYSLGYVNLNQRINANKLSFFMIGAVSSTLMLAIAGDLITTFIFYELLTLLTFPLILGIGVQKEINAARKYIVILMGLSLILFLPAIAIVYYFAGDVSFTAGGVLKSSNIATPLAVVAFLMFIYGVAKTAIMPVHFWLPSAMVAPIPVSALLHAVAVVKSGLLVLLKICVYIYGIDYLSEMVRSFWNSNFIIILCGASVIFSAIIASYQTNIKKLLAYSTINHLSICLLSVFMFSIAGIKAAIFHMIGHAVSKLSLFFATGILESKYGGTNIINLIGLVKKSKGLALLFTVAILSMIGIPPLAGFVGKAYIFYASINDKVDYIVVATLTISILISASYFIRLIYNMYFVVNKSVSLKVSKEDKYSEGAMKIATILSCCCILCYVFSFPFLMKFLDKIQFKDLAEILKEGVQ